jgi:hypothetical protein
MAMPPSASTANMQQDTTPLAEKERGMDMASLSRNKNPHRGVRQDFRQCSAVSKSGDQASNSASSEIGTALSAFDTGQFTLASSAISRETLINSPDPRDNIASSLE